MGIIMSWYKIMDLFDLQVGDQTFIYEIFYQAERDF